MNAKSNKIRDIKTILLIHTSQYIRDSFQNISVVSKTFGNGRCEGYAVQSSFFVFTSGY